jgi:SAM-dependent methyltransferase
MGRFWDARAREDALYFIDSTRAYGDDDVESFWADGERTIDGILELVGARLRSGDVVLDLGCGVGRLTRALAQRTAHVHALDVSSEMLERARELNAQLTNVSWHHGDGTTLHPLEDASVDVALSHVVFQHIPDPQITLGYVAELGRVLRPGGWTAFQISDDPSLHRVRIGRLDRVRAALGRAPKGQDEPEWLGSAVDLGGVRATAEQAGLTIDRITGEGTQFCYVRATATRGA